MRTQASTVAIMSGLRHETANDFKATRPWQSPKEAAEYTGIGLSTLAKLRLRGGGPAYSLRRR